MMIAMTALKGASPDYAALRAVARDAIMWPETLSCANDVQHIRRLLHVIGSLFLD